MTVQTRRSTTTLTCGQCKTASMQIHKRDVPAAEWKDNSGWKELRQRAYRAGWRISASMGGAHYCPKCISEYDF